MDLSRGLGDVYKRQVDGSRPCIFYVPIPNASAPKAP
jgi:hypothetical protein